MKVYCKFRREDEVGVELNRQKGYRFLEGFLGMYWLIYVVKKLEVWNMLVDRNDGYSVYWWGQYIDFLVSLQNFIGLYVLGRIYRRLYEILLVRNNEYQINYFFKFVY